MTRPQQTSAIALPLGANRRRWEWGQAIVLAGLLILLTLFILYPLLRVLVVAVSDGQGFTLRHLLNFFDRPLFREALLNSLASGGLAVLFGSLLGVPLAYFSVRYQFRGKLLLQTLGVFSMMNGK